MAAKTVQLNSFCGGTSKLLDSAFLGFEESVNMYPETVEATDTYTRNVLKGIEGFKQFGNLSIEIEQSIGEKKMFLASKSPENSVNAGEPVLYRILGNDIYRVYKDASLRRLGTLRYTDDNFRVLFCDNISFTETSGAESYLIICGKAFVRTSNPLPYERIEGLIYCIPLDKGDTEFTDDDLRPLELPDAFDHYGKIVPTQAAFLNGRIIVNDEGHDYIYWSELNKPDGVNNEHAFQQLLTRYTYRKKDGTMVSGDDNQFYPPAYGSYVEDTLRSEEVWMAALNNVKVDFRADTIKGIMAVDQSFIVLGSSSYQVYKWQNSLYCPYITTSKTSMVGLRASEACATMDNAVYFLGSGSTGANAVWKATDVGLERISNVAMEQKIASVKDQDKTFAFTYSYKGHSFFVLSFYGEEDDFTVCYDVTTGVWHTRCSMDSNGGLHCWDARYAVQAYGKVIFSSLKKGGFYTMDVDSYEDTMGNPIPRIRTTGIKFDGGNDVIAHTLELITDNGATKNPELDPRVMLQVSHDGGFTWSSEKWVRAGRLGRIDYRTLFDGLGTSSKFAFRVKMTDKAPFSIATAMLNYTPCKNRIF